MDTIQINLLAVALAAILNMAIGFLWYSPWMFGKMWMQLSHIQQKDCKQSPWTLLYGFLVSLVIAYFLAFFAGALGVSTAGEGAMLGFYFWLSFIATTQISGVIWSQRPWKLFLLDTGYKLVTMVVMGGVIGA